MLFAIGLDPETSFQESVYQAEKNRNRSEVKDSEKYFVTDNFVNAALQHSAKSSEPSRRRLSIQRLKLSILIAF